MSFQIATLRAMTLILRSNELTSQIMTSTSRQQMLANQSMEIQKNYSSGYIQRLSSVKDANEEDFQEIMIDNETFKSEYETMMFEINQQEKLLDTERSNLETQLQAVNQEKTANDKLIESDIKSSFGTLSSST